MRKILLVALLALGLCVCSCGKNENTKRIEHIEKYDLPALTALMQEQMKKGMKDLEHDNALTLKAAIELGANHLLVKKMEADTKLRMANNRAKITKLTKEISNLNDTLLKLKKN